MLSAEAAEMADYLRGFVTIGEHELREDGSAPSAGSVVGEANRLPGMARRVLEAAVVYARLGKVTWEEVGGALDVTRQSAQERFDEVVDEFREALLSPEYPDYTGKFGQLRWRLHPAAREPEATAQDLDEWVRRHRDPDDVVDEPEVAPVSGGLTRMDPYAEQRWHSARAHQQWKDAADDVAALPPIEDRIEVAEAILGAWERIAASQTRVSAPTRDGLAAARRSVAELRAQLTTAPSDETTRSSR
ncbi:hypothetical protein DMC63_37745 [Streptomyces sp. WAC 05977]|nr:hypothetical protein DMC63_37745 [Streptomyces sp. WAC 05977]